MNNIPIEYIYNRGFHEVGNYFEEIIKGQRLNGKVAIHYTDFTDSILFAPCDELGYPKVRYYEFLTMMASPKLVMDFSSPTYMDSVQVFRKCVEVREPLSYLRVPSERSMFEDTYIFMWKGEIRNKQEMKVEELDVKYLMQLAQEAIQKREPIILDEVIKNKLIK
jgi:hypothetical protein